MINKLKHNTKIKIISLLSAVVLWLYVMTVVDPQGTKLFENVPITISNMSDLSDRDLQIYPEKELTMDIYITGKLSNIQKVKKEDIHIYGKIEKPIEGNNQVYLTANVPSSVSPELKSTITTTTLDKIIKVNKPITLNIIGKSKDNIDKDGINMDIENVSVLGPRTLVNQVDKVIAILDTGSKVDDFKDKLMLTPVNLKGEKVEGVVLSKSEVNANVKLLGEKTIPIDVKLQEGSESLKYYLSQDTVTIKGKREIVDVIDSIATKPIDLTDISSDASKEVQLEIPEGISIVGKSITIRLETVKTITKDFTYSSSDIEIRNNADNIDVSNILIPESVNVSVEYKDTITDLSKSGIKLYIDLSEEAQNKTYKINYDTDYELNKISIKPETIEVK